MFPLATTYDDAARFLVQTAGGDFLAWLLRLGKDQYRFDSWTNSVLTLPGSKERICDAVAHVSDLSRDGVPIAVLVEIETRADVNMYGRLLVAGGICVLTTRPTDLPGDRYGLCAVVINLTGRGHSEGETVFGDSLWKMRPAEWNMETLQADEILDGIEAGTVPKEMMPYISLMKKGDEEGIIKRWLEIANREPDLAKRGHMKLVIVFANALDRQDVWMKALEGFDVIESSVVNEWKAEAAKQAAKEAARTTRIETIIELLNHQYGEVPDTILNKVRGGQDSNQVAHWFRIALETTTLDDFVKQAGLID